MVGLERMSDYRDSLYVRRYAALEMRSKWWMDKCPSGDVLGQIISALLRRILGHIYK